MASSSTSGWWSSTRNTKSGGELFTLGAFAIIFDDLQRVLLCHRRDMDMWNLPGGGVDSGELPTDACIREAKEETGLDVTNERLVGVYGKQDKDELVFTFICQVIGGELRLNDEADDLQYFSIDALPRNTLPKHVERIQDALLPSTQPVFRVQTAPSSQEWLKMLNETGG